MPKASKKGGKGKTYSVPTSQRKKDLGVPKIAALKDRHSSAAPYSRDKPIAKPTPGARSIAALASTSNHLGDTFAAASAKAAALLGGGTPVDASLTVRDSSAKAFMRELRKVIERADVIIQVLDARDPDGTRSKWVEEEVRKRDAQGKKLLAVINKIDLVPRENLEAWIKHLRHSFPTMPFKSSTQNQRQNLSQHNISLASAQPAKGEIKAAKLPELPQTSSSLGAPALLNLLKQYALSTPHNSLTIGVVGYPNVGKSSLINSLKRSRACGVAAMPGKTRVVQEVVLDKGVKILDCPGVVLEDIGREFEGENGRLKQAEIMLRNCIKPELVEDPTAPIEVILARADPALIERMYNIPSYSDSRDFLIKIALLRGRLGKGGVPDLEAAAVTVLRDWNSGKIPYHTVPPKVHASSMPQAAQPANADDMVMDGVEQGEQVGAAKILNTLSEAFTLDGLFDNLGDEAAWDGEDESGFAADEGMDNAMPSGVAQPMQPSAPTVVEPSRPVPSRFTRGMSSDSDMDSDRSASPDMSPISRPSALPSNGGAFGFGNAGAAHGGANAYMPMPAQRGGVAAESRLFTSEELNLLPEGMLDRKRTKQQAKKAKKRAAAAQRTEGELLLGFMDMGMDVDGQEPDSTGAGASMWGPGGGVDGMEGADEAFRPSKKQVRAEKRAVQKAQVRAARDAAAPALTEEEQREADFSRFLDNMGADEDEEL